MARFFTADTHFGHANILRYCDRPFANVPEMNYALLSRFHAQVAAEDELWVLGDLAMGPLDESLAIASQLPGIKHLIVGNHDRPFAFEPGTDKFARATQRYVDAGFTVHHGLAELTIDGVDVHLHHFPYVGDSHDEDRYADRRPTDDGHPLLHGHIHDVRRIDGRMFNVGVDVNDFSPVSEEEVSAWLRTLR